MKEITTQQFSYCFRYAGMRDIGRQRSTNQDEVILCPELGIFAVSDGMGGLAEGAKAADYVAKAVPAVMRFAVSDAETAEDAGRAFAEMLRMLSDELFETANSPGQISFGATCCGVWLYQDKAVFVNLGDSRAYILRKSKRKLTPVTEDHNVAAMLIKSGELSPEAAKDHPSSSKLTRFVGMPAPALPDYFVCDVAPGDRLLVGSDGLYGMIDETEMARIMRSSKSPQRVCSRLVDVANRNGGRDNISAVYVAIGKPKLGTEAGV